MAKKCGWHLLQEGDLHGALKLLKAEHRRDPSKGTCNNLGTCHLCLGDAQAAKDCFDEALAMPLPDSGTCALAGMARWILKDRTEAVRIWQEGLDYDYRDAAGGVELPLLSFYAAVREPLVFSLTRAKKLIRESLKSSWVHKLAGSAWPLRTDSDR